MTDSEKQENLYSGRGGKRAGAGRPKGTKRSLKTINLQLRVTPQEKEIIKNFIADYRKSLEQ